MQDKLRIIKSRYGLFKHSRRKTFHPGDNALHVIAREYRPNDLRLFIDATRKDKLVQMAKTCNDEGKLPIDYVSPLQEEQGDRPVGKKRKAMASMLYPYTMQNPFRPMNELLDVGEVLKKFRHLYIKHPRLKKNLEFACETANVVRRIILHSGTHPDVNAMNEADKSYEDIAIDYMRDRIDEIGDRDEIMDCADVRKRRKQVHEEANVIRQYQAGNCEEYCYVLADIMLKMQPTIRLELFELKRGDHVFVVLDRKADSDEHDYRTWGDNAVVCDAWSGKVFPAACLPENLYVFSSRQFVDVDRITCLVTHFNPRFHRPDLYISLTESPGRTAFS